MTYLDLYSLRYKKACDIDRPMHMVAQKT